MSTFAFILLLKSFRKPFLPSHLNSQHAFPSQCLRFSAQDGLCGQTAGSSSLDTLHHPSAPSPVQHCQGSRAACTSLWTGSCGSICCTSLLFTHFLGSSKSIPTLKVQIVLLRTSSASVLYPQRGLCPSAPQLSPLCFPFSAPSFLFSILSSCFGAEQQISP